MKQQHAPQPPPLLIGPNRNAQDQEVIRRGNKLDQRAQLATLLAELNDAIRNRTLTIRSHGERLASNERNPLRIGGAR